MKLWRLVAGVLAFVAVGAGVSPAWACACGGYLSDAGSRARAFGENALVRFDGTQEEIVLSMSIQGQSKKAAWIMPVPAAAKVELGDRDLFYRLESITRPKVVIRKTYWPFRDLGIMGSGRGDSAGAAPGSAVNVHQQMVLGPFQVARLGGTSATAVTDWLSRNGYVVPAGLATNLTPYITENWEIVAVKLAPGREGGSMSGSTPPLRLSFPSTRIVYPMRLSKGATTDQTVTVYVAAPYRVDTTKLPDPAIKPELLYAGRTEGESYPQLAAPTSFLTAYTVSYTEPGRITDDFVFAKAATDAEYQRVTYVTRNDGLLSTIGVIFGILLLVGAGAAVIARILVRRSAS
ncbi:uncharacterized protein DUF2330 [Kribbella orskensis]|uniref:Uncharacterized protein DUF2330 n=1 Tax=Kribbella orskensis TaxID=2512216 RepID=A0ABY2BNP3_9ACTN|nr:MULTISPECIES: DUF2330 domain-containing protein [Kribbella]TCN42045.1 uncharacterized protein DUF2330 [Kribbella sp. VKM Ac-2500]TCO25923.1 uncharacterized protein DUF2330 [Kribbella orskensis]